jgi:glutamate synthase domain-containing protein 3
MDAEVVVMAVRQEIKSSDEHIRKKIDLEGRDLRFANQMIKKTIKAGDTAVILHCEQLNGLAAGLRNGNVVIEDRAGDYVAALNSGAKITICGDVGNFVADNMVSGEVLVKGNAGYCAAPYCYGGYVFISGTSGDFTGTMNKGATIIVEKEIGNDAATYMLAGNVILLENARERLGNFLISGAIFIRGSWLSLGHNTAIEDLTPNDTDFLQHLFSKYNIRAKPESFTKIVPETDSPFYSKKK